MTLLRPVAAAALFFGCTAASTAQKDKELDFGDFNVKFAVPAGWKVLKTEKKKDSAFIVLQETAVAKAAKSKATLGLFMGKKYIAEAPASGDVNAGNDASGALLASRRVLAFAAGTPDKLAPLQSQDVLFGLTLGDTKQITLEYKTRTQTVYGYGSSKREGGELVAAAVADATAIERVKATLNGLVGYDPRKKK
jgi:hypothetical protein